jgi:hypothetical protein
MMAAPMRIARWQLIVLVLVTADRAENRRLKSAPIEQQKKAPQ